MNISFSEVGFFVCFIPLEILSLLVCFFANCVYVSIYTCKYVNKDTIQCNTAENSLDPQLARIAKYI